MTDMINHPPHYTSHPSGVEPIEITRHLNFCLGNAVKYLMRYRYKGNPLEDLRKARFYLFDELWYPTFNGVMPQDEVDLLHRVNEHEQGHEAITYLTLHLQTDIDYAHLEAAIEEVDALIEELS